jgi:FecR protein
MFKGSQFDGSERQIFRRTLLSLTGAGLLALASPFRKALARQVAGSVDEVRGEAFAEAEKERRKLESAAPVFLADEVSTGTASRLAIHLGADTIIRLGELAHLVIDRTVENAGGDHTLTSGAVLFDRKAGAEPRPVRIRSSFGLIAVRGTRFFAGPSAGVFGVFVQRGNVVVRAAGQEVILSEGQGTNIARPGDVPTPPAPWGQPRIDAALASIN